jgi:hypothetical protein
LKNIALFKNLVIVSGVRVTQKVSTPTQTPWGMTLESASGQNCERYWRIDPQDGEDEVHPG